MPKFYGLNPAPSTRQAIEQFENNVLIRHNNQQLLGTVYVDMQEDHWSVAFAYNYSGNQGCMGTRTLSKCGTPPGRKMQRMCRCSDPMKKPRRSLTPEPSKTRMRLSGMHWSRSECLQERLPERESTVEPNDNRGEGA